VHPLTHIHLTWVELALAISVWYERSEAAAAHVAVHQAPAGAANVVATLVYGGAGGQLFLHAGYTVHQQNVGLAFQDPSSRRGGPSRGVAPSQGFPEGPL
jgi:hypothetical protein